MLMQANMRTRLGLLYERTGLGISFWVSARVVEGLLLLLCLCVCASVREGEWEPYELCLYEIIHALKPMSMSMNSDWKTQKGIKTRLSHGCRSPVLLEVFISVRL